MYNKNIEGNGKDDTDGQKNLIQKVIQKGSKVMYWNIRLDIRENKTKEGRKKFYDNSMITKTSWDRPPSNVGDR